MAKPVSGDRASVPSSQGGRKLRRTGAKGKYRYGGISLGVAVTRGEATTLELFPGARTANGKTAILKSFMRGPFDRSGTLMTFYPRRVTGALPKMRLAAGRSHCGN
jgi:hypothetical protein